MSSYPAGHRLTSFLAPWLAAVLLACSPLVQAASSVAVGSGSRASVGLNFRIVIPDRLELSVSEALDGPTTLSAEMYSRRGPLMVSVDDGRGETALADRGEGDILKTSTVEARGGVYTIASP